MEHDLKIIEAKIEIVHWQIKEKAEELVKLLIEQEELKKGEQK